MSDDEDDPPVEDGPGMMMAPELSPKAETETEDVAKVEDGAELVPLADEDPAVDAFEDEADAFEDEGAAAEDFDAVLAAELATEDGEGLLEPEPC